MTATAAYRTLGCVELDAPPTIKQYPAISSRRTKKQHPLDKAFAAYKAGTGDFDDVAVAISDDIEKWHLGAPYLGGANRGEQPEGAPAPVNHILVAKTVINVARALPGWIGDEDLPPLEPYRGDSPFSHFCHAVAANAHLDLVKAHQVDAKREISFSSLVKDSESDWDAIDTLQANDHCADSSRLEIRRRLLDCPMRAKGMSRPYTRGQRFSLDTVETAAIVAQALTRLPENKLQEVWNSIEDGAQTSDFRHKVLPRVDAGPVRHMKYPPVRSVLRTIERAGGLMAVWRSFNNLGLNRPTLLNVVVKDIPADSAFNLSYPGIADGETRKSKRKLKEAYRYLCGDRCSTCAHSINSYK